MSNPLDNLMSNSLGKMMSNPLDTILTDFSKVDFRNSINAGGELFYLAFQEYIKGREAALAKGESLMVIHYQTGRPIAVHSIGYISSQVFLQLAGLPSRRTGCGQQRRSRHREREFRAARNQGDEGRG